MTVDPPARPVTVIEPPIVKPVLAVRPLSTSRERAFVFTYFQMIAQYPEVSFFSLRRRFIRNLEP
jgi:hypothetical protein